MKFLLGPAGIKRKTVKNLLKFGAISVNGVPIRQFNHPLAPGDEVALGELRTAVARNELEFARIQIVYEDDDLLVLDKPSGLLTVATDRNKTDTLYARLRAYLLQRDDVSHVPLGVVHRLDHETSGLVLFAKDRDVKQALQDMWPAVIKTYAAVVEGRPEQDQGTVESYLTEASSLKVYSNPHPSPGGKLATTHYRVVVTRGDLSLLEVRLETGRKHQIRVHLADLGCRVAGDRRYGATANPCHRLALHASGLDLSHPMTGKPLEFRSPVPKVMTRLFEERNR